MMVFPSFENQSLLIDFCCSSDLQYIGASMSQDRSQMSKFPAPSPVANTAGWVGLHLMSNISVSRSFYKIGFFRFPQVYQSMTYQSTPHETINEEASEFLSRVGG